MRHRGMSESWLVSYAAIESGLAGIGVFTSPELAQDPVMPRIDFEPPSQAAKTRRGMPHKHHPGVSALQQARTVLRPRSRGVTTPA